MQDDNGNNGFNLLEVFDGDDSQNSNYNEEDSDEDDDMDIYQSSTTITHNNMGSWLNNVNNMLNANNLTIVTDISEESQKSSNNNTFVDDIDMAVQDELVQDELRQLNNPGSQSGSPPSDGGQAGAQPPSK